MTATDLAFGSREGSVAWAERVLRDQGMPAEELRVVLASDDAETVRRHLELHLERLEERLDDQRRWAASAQRILAETASAPVTPDPSPGRRRRRRT